ncbi:5'-nucleotidase, lipoprotein e(P4) family [Sphingomonas guangdongensis]|uniref:5'-nucleotidase, lipoprotein e(P4) family n=1 Tax=Sphingomonas guangdongensis TaxID=1141890 RepID=A0A285R4R9_9SPHN|nr:5'-nucleotidase, lipoprotein e(P4) family [Sphingomonas guangdongensis]
MRLGVILMPAALGGCVAAAALAPVVASSTAIVRSRMQEAQVKRRAPPATPVASDPAPPQALRIGDAPALPPASTGTMPAGMQYLYGSGEAVGASVQAYQALARYLRDQAAVRSGLRQLVLADGATLDAPRFEPCGPKPKAVVLDIDETALLNLGYEADEARRGSGYDQARWERWERTGADKVVAVPGAKAALDAARAAGITVIFNSNRANANAAATEAALTHAGLGPARHGTTLWLRGDDGGGSGKDDRRWAIASGYCVVALVGDQLGDFSDLFNVAGLTPSTRRALAGGPALARLWGNGWFVLPNPVYGTALKGDADEIFPRDTRWTDPAQEK